MRSPVSCSGDATESEMLERFAKERRYELHLSLWAHARKSKLGSRSSKGYLKSDALC